MSGGETKMTSTSKPKRNHGDGGIDRRGEDRHRLRWRVDGMRYSKTFRGSVTEARRELRRLLKDADDGKHVTSDQTLVADYLQTWLAGDPNLSPKTRERYRQLAERQIIPHLGNTLLQQLRPLQIADWHNTLLKTGLSSRTVGHAHRVLHRGLERALKLDEIVLRNVAHAVPPPRVQDHEVAILTADQVSDTLHRIKDHPLYSIVKFAVTTGLRRGEICGLTVVCLDLDAGKVRVERSLEETEAGLRFKPPKTRYGYRTVTLPGSTIEAMRDHCRRQLVS
jgi:integrase